MPKGIFRDSSPLTKLTLTGTVVLLSLFFFYSIGLLIIKLQFKINIESLGNKGAYDFIASHATAFKIFQVLQSIGFFILPPFLIGFLIERNAFAYLRLNTNSSPFSYLIVPLVFVVSIPFINYLMFLNQGLHLPGALKSVEEWIRQGEDNAEALSKVFLKANDWKDLVSNLMLIAVLPAVGEELLFRGILQKQFTELSRNAHLGIWIAAFLFSFMHFQFYGFLPRLVLGVLLGYIFYFSRSLWMPILAHFTNNALAVIFSYLYSTGQVNKSAEEIGTLPDELPLIFFSLVLTVILLYGLYRTEKNRAKLSPPQ